MRLVLGNLDIVHQRLGLFCDYPLTPRNLLILAERDC